MRIFEMSAKVGHDAGRILNIHGGVTELQQRERKLRVDDWRPRVEVLIIHGVPLAVVVKRRHIVRVMHAFRKPADAVVAHKAVFHIFDKALVRIHPVDGDLLYKPCMLALIAHSNGYLHKLFLYGREIGIKAQTAVVTVFGIIVKDALFNFLWNRSYIIFGFIFSPQFDFVAEHFVQNCKRFRIECGDVEFGLIVVFFNEIMYNAVLVDIVVSSTQCFSSSVGTGDVVV